MRIRYKILIGSGIFFFVILFLGVILNSASRSENRAYDLSAPQGVSEEVSAPQKSGTSTKESTTATTKDISSRIVVKSGNLNLVVKDIDSTIKQVIDYTQSNGGWILESNVLKKNEIPTGTITVRVPVKDFENAITYFSSLSVKVENEKREGQDVTEEYADLESQLKNLQATETQFLKIMEKAATIADTLQVQKELTTVRGEIEKIKGQMLFLQRSGEMAKITVNLALSEELLPIPSSEKWKPKYVAKQAWINVVAFWKGFSYLVINLLVYALIFVPLIMIIVIIRLIKRRKGGNKKKEK